MIYLTKVRQHRIETVPNEFNILLPCQFEKSDLIINRGIIYWCDSCDKMEISYVSSNYDLIFLPRPGLFSISEDLILDGMHWPSQGLEMAQMTEGLQKALSFKVNAVDTFHPETVKIYY